MTVGAIPLRHAAQVLVSNVDKKSADGDPSVRLVNYTDVYYNGEITADLSFMEATATSEQVRKFRLLPGDSIITKDSETPDDIGVPAFVQSATSDMVCGYHLALLRPRHGLYPKYLYWALVTKETREQFAVAANGMTRYGLTYDAIQSAKIPVPDVDEQRRIADFLDDQINRIDQIIAARQQQEALVGELGLELQRGLTTVGRSTQLRSTRVSWMPEVAEPWPVLRVSQLFSTGSGTTPSTNEPAYFGGSIPWVNTGDLTDGPVVSIAKTVTEQALRDYPTLRVYNPGALVIAMYGQGATKGRIGILEVGGCVNQACCVLSPTGAMLTAWAAAWFRAHKVPIVELAMGSGQPNLSQEIIRSLRIPAPPLSVQRDILADMSRELLDLQSIAVRLAESVNLLQEFKRSLISSGVSGELDVATARGRGVPM